MSEMNTPGPWHPGQGNGEGCVFADKGESRMRYENGTTLYPICSVIDMQGEGEANVRLIAAAPELLDLVRTAYDRFTDNDMQPPNHLLRTWLESASAAIAKATGEAVHS